jgi:ABC-type molybdate transport system permease subunit
MQTEAYYHLTGKSLLETLIYLPMALPPTVIGFYLIIIIPVSYAFLILINKLNEDSRI